MNEKTEAMEDPVEMDPAQIASEPPADDDCALPDGAGLGGTVPGEAEAADAPRISDPEGADPDPAGDPADPGAGSSDSEELSALREELTRLREELTRKEAVMSRLGRECAEFRQLYPEVPLSEIPDDAWDAVRSGVPLPAAFALSERKKVRIEQLAQESNRQNRTRSSGQLGQAAPGYFSYEEVRRMTREEVRENYNNILLSMQKWH